MYVPAIYHEAFFLSLPLGSNVRAWLGRLFAHSSFRATCSTEEPYLDSNYR